MTQLTTPDREKPTVQLTGNDGNAFAVMGASLRTQISIRVCGY